MKRSFFAAMTLFIFLASCNKEVEGFSDGGNENMEENNLGDGRFTGY